MASISTDEFIRQLTEQRQRPQLERSLAQETVKGQGVLAGRGISQQPRGFEGALALLRGLRRSQRFQGFFDPENPAAVQRELSRDQPQRRTTILSGAFNRSKLSPTGTKLGEPTRRLP